MTIKEELQEYARQCLSGVIISGKKHKWACRRFLEDCKKEAQTFKRRSCGTADCLNGMAEIQFVPIVWLERKSNWI